MIYVAVIIVVVLNLFWFIFAKTRGFSREEEHILRHGNLDEVIGVLSDESTKHAVPKREIYTSSERIRKSQDLLADGGWKCSNCGVILASYVGTCGCGCMKNETKQQYIARINGKEIKETIGKIAQDEAAVYDKEMKNIDIIKEYRSLYDAGTITEEEFIRKKEELLGTRS